MIRVRNKSNGTLTLNFLNRVIPQGGHVDLESDVMPQEVMSLMSYNIVSVELIDKPKLQTQEDKKTSKSRNKED